MLRLRVHGALDEASYAAAGRAIDARIIEAFRGQGVDPGNAKLLDFACGPGRLAAQVKAWRRRAGFTDPTWQSSATMPCVGTLSSSSITANSAPCSRAAPPLNPRATPALPGSVSTRMGIPGSSAMPATGRCEPLSTTTMSPTLAT